MEIKGILANFGEILNDAADNLELQEDFIKIIFTTNKISYGLPITDGKIEKINKVMPAQLAQIEYIAERVAPDTFRVTVEADIDGTTIDFKMGVVAPVAVHDDLEYAKLIIESKIKQETERGWKMIERFIINGRIVDLTAEPKEKPKKKRKPKTFSSAKPRRTTPKRCMVESDNGLTLTIKKRDGTVNKFWMPKNGGTVRLNDANGDEICYGGKLDGLRIVSSEDYLYKDCYNWLYLRKIKGLGNE